MDTSTLVDDRIEIGQKLIELLSQTGFDVSAACWAKTADEGNWLLYICSETVDRIGSTAAYSKLHQVFKFTPNDWDLISAISLVGRDHPIAESLRELRERLMGRLPSRVRTIQLGNHAVDEVYVYEPPKAQPIWPRQSFTITYHRQGATDAWRAETRREAVYRGTTARGAVGYSTAHFEGEKEGEERFAVVSVLLELDPRFDKQNTFIDPAVRQMMTDQAREMADELFKARHPDAVIQHVDSY